MRRAFAAVLLAATTLAAPALADPPDTRGMARGWAATSYYLANPSGKTAVPDDYLTRWTHTDFAHFSRDYLYPWPGDGVPLFSGGILESGLVWIPKAGKYRIRSTIGFIFNDHERAKPECVQRIATNGATILSTDALGFDGKPEKGNATQMRSGHSKTIEADGPGFVRIDNWYACPLSDPDKEMGLLATDLAVDKNARKNLAAYSMSHESGDRFRRFPERFMAEWLTGVYFDLDLVDEDERIVPLDRNTVFHPAGVVPDATATSFSPDPVLGTGALWEAKLTNKRNGEVLETVEMEGAAPNIGEMMRRADMPKVAVAFKTRFAGTKPERVGLAFGLRQDREQTFARRCEVPVTVTSKDGRVETLRSGVMTSQRIGSVWSVAFATLEPGDVIETKPDCDIDDVMGVRRQDRNNLVRGENLALSTLIRREGEPNFRLPTVNDLDLPPR